MQSVLSLPAAALAWLGRYGTRALALSVFAGIALPPLASFFRPLFTIALLTLMTLAFLRVDPDALRGYFRRPLLILLASGWIMLATPLLLVLVLYLFDIRVPSEAIFLALVFQAVAPPIGSAPALAALIGLDAALSLATLIVCFMLTPLTAPILATVLAGPGAVSISAMELGLKLFTMLAGTALVSYLIRHIAGKAWVESQSERIDGLNVIAMFIFAVGVMDGVAANMIARPLLVLSLIGVVFAVAFGLIALTAIVMLPAGRSAAFAIAVAAGNLNMGLMLAASSTVPELTWLYFGLAQFPIYLLPQMLKPLARRIPVTKSA